MLNELKEVNEANFVPKDLLAKIQANIPIFCVDIVPVKYNDVGRLSFGLILRDTPDLGNRWCFIGGRLRLDEAISAAADRELNSALGDSLQRDDEFKLEHILIEYSRERRQGYPYDLRQHAISATIPILMSGDGIAQGDEAKDFKWWLADELDGEIMGFGQERLVGRERAQSDTIRVVNPA